MIQVGDRVTLHYELTLDNSEVFDSTFAEAPESITIGDGELPEAMEIRISMLEAGEVVEFCIEADENAFGKYDSQNRQYLARELFEQGVPNQGSLLEFELPGGGWVRGRVENVLEDQVLVDFNHPLIGRNVNCRVEIIKIESTRIMQ